MAILRNLSPIKTFWYAPAPIFTARINMPGAITYPIQDIPFDGVTTGAYTDCAADMFFTLGSAAGKDDYGRGRLRSAPTSSLLKVGRSSQGFQDGQLSVVNDAYISVYPDYRVHSKISTIRNFIEYKDTDIAVGDLTVKPPPVANMGPDRARSIDKDTGKVRFYFDGRGSFAVADGATITGYAWDVGDGEFALGTTATDDDIFVDFEAGVRYVALTVTDSNGKTNTTRRLVLADDPANSLCVSGMQAQSLTRSQQGCSARLRVLKNLPRADYPDGGHILIWEDRNPAVYGTPSPSDYSDLWFTGWHQTDQASSRRLETHLQRETTLLCVDVLGRMDSLPGFPQRVEVPDEVEGLTWGEMPAANMDKFMCYLVQWCGTGGGVADFFPSGTWDEYPFVLFDSAGDTLYNQLQRQANRIVPDHNFTSDRYGAMRVVVNPQFQNSADRTAVIQGGITVQTWSEIEFEYQRPPRVHTTRGSALLTQTEWIIGDDDAKELLPPVFSVAPGTAPGQGARENTLGERLAKSQEDLNDCIGHHHENSNARYGLITVTLNANADPWDFDTAAHTWVQLIVPEEAAPYRGIDFETTRTLPTEVTIDLQYGEEGRTWKGRVTLEVETVGLPALTEVTEEALPVGEQPAPPEIVVPDYGLVAGQEWLVGIAPDSDFQLYRTFDFQTPASSGGPTWTQHALGITDLKLFSFVVDPFSPGYRPDGGTVNGWAVGTTKIWRIEDMFGTPTATAAHTFPTAIASTGIFRSRTIAASFGRYFEAEEDNPWLMVVTHYTNASGHTGTWATYSVDAGATWSSEVQITAHYDTDQSGADPRVVLGVYLSPRTPGLAFVFAYTSTANPATVDGFVTTDWGATWTAMSNPNIAAGNRLGGDIHVPWPDNDDEKIVYHGHVTRGASIQYRLKRVEADGTTVTDISPLVSGKRYGVNRHGFAIRSFDSDRQFMVFGGVGNDATASTTNDLHGLFVSENGGNTWTAIITPVADNAFGVEKGFSAAFAASNPDILYIWGGSIGNPGTISYSDDFGATIDDRAGNIHADWGIHGTPDSFIGIAGGPIS